MVRHGRYSRRVLALHGPEMWLVGKWRCTVHGAIIAAWSDTLKRGIMANDQVYPPRPAHLMDPMSLPLHWLLLCGCCHRDAAMGQVSFGNKLRPYGWQWQLQASGHTAHSMRWFPWGLEDEKNVKIPGGSRKELQKFNREKTKQVQKWITVSILYLSWPKTNRWSIIQRFCHRCGFW